ncbi:MAG: UDP binding domain-containing protein, partial [Noviherbaspirillum sp.]
DLRNTKVMDTINKLKDYNINVDVYDPWVSVEGAQREYGITPIPAPEQGKYDAIILAVAHREFKEMGAAALRSFGKDKHVLFDLKYLLPKSQADIRL